MVQAFQIPTSPDAGLGHVSRALLFADVVGSMRLVEADEEGAVRRWLDFSRLVNERVLPSCQGRQVKQLGDGLMIEFGSAVAAVKAALLCFAELQEFNASLAQEHKLELRAGIHIGDVLTGDGSDLFGRHVAIASRIMSLAGSGEIVATIDVRDAVAGQIDIDFEDMGDCYLRHLTAPVRVFRLSAPGILPRIRPVLSAEDLMPTVAVIPFAWRHGTDVEAALSDVLAEEIIVALSRSQALNVTSRLSTTVFREGRVPLATVGNALHADFVLSGTCHSDERSVLVDLELAEVRTERVAWATRIKEALPVLLAEPAAIDALASSVHQAILSVEVRRARSMPAPALDNYSLLMAATALMHRPSRRDFDLAQQLLLTLMDRAPDLPAAMAAMARWHVLRVQQGWTDEPMRAGSEALHLTQRALDIDPSNVMALVSEGFVLTNLIHRLDDAVERYDAALDQSPNDATGRLLRGTLHAFRGDGARATRDTERALHLAPLDPHRYFFESLAASACIAAGDNARALALARQSLRSNRGHTSTLRVKAVAELRLGDGDAARATVRELLRQQPGLTVSGWLKTAASADYEVGRAFARSLAEAGVPE